MLNCLTNAVNNVSVQLGENYICSFRCEMSIILYIRLRDPSLLFRHRLWTYRTQRVGTGLIIINNVRLWLPGCSQTIR